MRPLPPQLSTPRERASGVSAPQRRAPRETQPLHPLKPRFVTIYGDHIAPTVKGAIGQMLANSCLLPETVDAGGVDVRKTAREVARRVEADGHLLICVHGKNTAPPRARSAPARHLARLPMGGRDFVATEVLLKKIVARLALKQRHASGAPAALPCIFLFSCESGALRKQIRPGSDLWKSAWLMIFSSSHSTSLNASSHSVGAAIAYVDHCRSRGETPDPMKLMGIAGLRRGDCITLMGGDLEAPLVWHAPKSEADLADEVSLRMLAGTREDRRRLLSALKTLQPAEASLLPAHSLIDLAFNRVIRDDADALRQLLQDHPALLNTLSTMQDSLLIATADHHAARSMKLLLEAGVDPNEMTKDGTTALALSIPHFPDTGDPDSPDAKMFACLQLLLAAGADPNLRAEDEATPLMLATDAGHLPAMRALLAHGARMDLAVDGIRCLEDAAVNNQLPALQVLLEHGAGPADGLSPALIEETRALGHHAAARLMADALARHDQGQDSERRG